MEALNPIPCDGMCVRPFELFKYVRLTAQLRALLRSVFVQPDRIMGCGINERPLVDLISGIFQGKGRFHTSEVRL